MTTLGITNFIRFYALEIVNKSVIFVKVKCVKIASKAECTCNIYNFYSLLDFFYRWHLHYSFFHSRCVISNAYPWIYYGTFITPACCLLIINGFVFFRVSKVIFTPNLKIRSHTSNDNITATQVRGTFTVMILLGITWILGTFTFGPMKIVFMYIFCFLNPIQGFLIFVVRCLGFKEAKDAWIVFLRTGKLKSRRGVVPPGTVSYNSHSGVRSGVSPSTNVRTDSTDEPSSEERRRPNR